VKLVSDLQLTDGRLRGEYVLASTTKRGKVTPRRLREGILRTIERKLKAKRFLDLSGGCGMMGLEAISRGVALATMVERSARLRSVIAKNLEACGIKTGHSEVSDLEAVPFLKKMAKKRRRWDLVFIDAEIESDYEEAVRFLSRSRIVEPGGSVVVQHAESDELPESLGSLTRWRLYTHEGTSVSYYDRRK
jgi:16S rRNA (guanine966-N2)-methyltransferase